MPPGSKGGDAAVPDAEVLLPFARRLTALTRSFVSCGCAASRSAQPSGNSSSQVTSPAAPVVVELVLAPVGKQRELGAGRARGFSGEAAGPALRARWCDRALARIRGRVIRVGRKAPGARGGRGDGRRYQASPETQPPVRRDRRATRLRCQTGRRDEPMRLRHRAHAALGGSGDAIRRPARLIAHIAAERDAVELRLGGPRGRCANGCDGHDAHEGCPDPARHLTSVRGHSCSNRWASRASTIRS